MEKVVSAESRTRDISYDQSVLTLRRAAVQVGPATITLILGLMAVFLFLLFRNVGLNPSIFGDEWSYSYFSRLANVASSPTPNYVYFLFYRWTGASGSGFLECARILNSILFVLGSIFIYFTARRVATQTVAALVALVSIAGPINVYTAYFMPESMYFVVFWILTWFAITWSRSKPIYYGSTIGFLYAAMTMIKPNALFLLPGIVAFVLYNGLCQRTSQSRKMTFFTIGFLLITAVAVRLGVGYLVAGPAGLNILGSKYGTLASSAITWDRASEMSGLIIGILKGHIMGITLLFGMPIVSLGAMEISERRSPGQGMTLHLVEVYLVATIIPLLVVTAYFDASVVGTSPDESAARLAMRYYNFAFPLFLIIAAGQVSEKNRQRRTYSVLATVVLVVGICLYSFRVLLREYSPNSIDCPELHGFTAQLAMFYLMGAVGIASVIAFAVNRRLASQLFLFVFAPASILWSAYVTNSELRQRITPDVYNRAGMFAHAVLGQPERSKLVVGGSEIAGLLSVLFYVDDENAKMLFIPQGAPFDRAAVPNDREWLLLLGDHRVSPDIEAEIVEDGYSLFRLPKRISTGGPGSSVLDIDFSDASWFGMVNEVSGLSQREDFGRWSDEAEVTLKLSSPLPRAFNLHLKASAFGPNTELPFSLRIGSETRTFRLAETPTDVNFSFITNGTEKLITISVPKPTSPKQLGMSSDGRTLGIALRRMSIVSDGK